MSTEILKNRSKNEKFWLKQYQLIEKIIQRKLADKGQKYTRANAAALLGVTAAKIQAWGAGQRPVVEDLALLARELELSADWLLLGKGTPEAGQRAAAAPAIGQDFTAENIKGHLIGDNIWELLGLLGLDEKGFAIKTKLPLQDVQDILASRRKPTFDELTAMAQRLGISPAWLLIEQPPHFLANDLLSRIEQATGCSRKLGNLHWAVGADAQDMRDWLKAPGAKTFLPEEWMRGIVRRYHVSPQWLLHGAGPSHLSQEEVNRIAPESQAGQATEPDPAPSAGSASA